MKGYEIAGILYGLFVALFALWPGANFIAVGLGMVVGVLIRHAYDKRVGR